MAFKLIETAQKRWQRLRGYKHLADVITGVVFTNGVKQEQPETGRRLKRLVHQI